MKEALKDRRKLGGASELKTAATPGKRSRVEEAAGQVAQRRGGNRVLGSHRPLDFGALGVFRKADESAKEPATVEDIEAVTTTSSAPEAEPAGGSELPDEDGGGGVAIDAAADSSAQQLPDELRASLEAKTGEDLSDVRVHVGAKAAKAAAAIGAHAFTTGRDIFFAEGMFDPTNRAGKRLIAHEVAHTSQSAAGAGSSPANGRISEPNESAEIEADRFADEFDRGADREAASPLKERAAGKLYRYPGVVDVAFEEDKKRGIDPGNPKSEKVWTEQRGYIKNPTATRLADIVKDGKVTGKFANGKVMYVVDGAGDVWVGHRKGVNMPHPTLIGGKNPEVLAAGMVEMRGGKIVSIDNHSGHFRPPRSALRKAAKAFLKLPSNVFNKLTMKSVHFKKNGTEYWKAFRSLRMLKLKKLNLGKALHRVKMRYKHDPKFRGRIRGGAKGGLGIIVAAVVGYFFGKWLSRIDEENIRRDIEKLQPKVEAALKASLESMADTLDELFESDPKAKIHMNLVYRIGYYKYIDPEDGAEKDYHSTELVSAEFSTTPIESGTSYAMTETNTCGMSSMEYHDLRMSEELEVKDLFDAIEPE